MVLYILWIFVMDLMLGLFCGVYVIGLKYMMFVYDDLTMI